MFDAYYKEELRKAYQKGIHWVNMHSVAKADRMEVRMDITRQIDKALLVSGNVYFTDGEKNNILVKGKAAYRAYCAFMKAHPEENTDQLIDRVGELVNLLVKIELEKIVRFCWTLKEDEYLDIEKIFSVKQYVQELMKHPVTFVIDNAVKNKKLCAIGTQKLYYSTRSGRHFHLADCPYCNGKILCADTEMGHMDRGVKPCTCVIRMRKREIEAALPKYQDAHYMTAFVDESIRLNPGCLIDDTQDNNQNLLSVILCKGKIHHEAQITKGNTVAKLICIARRTPKTTDTAVEAIGTALLKAAASGFDKHLIIYTDNAAAYGTWKKRKELQLLTESFESVKVLRIDRKNNTKADELIRKNDLMLLPRQTMDKVVRLYNTVKNF
ncbi:hypothetical protein [Butyrivibrio sp. VCB2001]|uniref:hypothetical protein n=1 Tax=Butyrivibrio sp. VCB2001 TaxID=1280667 RepID=UPI0003FABE53|nr:hypothetical protein [Butyrivibrio sp. VCB2001]